jgi:hypothetical protein
MRRLLFEQMADQAAGARHHRECAHRRHRDCDLEQERRDGAARIDGDVPREIVGTLNGALKKSLDDAEFNRIAESQGARVVASSPEEFAAFLETESARLSKVIKDANIGVR